MRQIVEYSLRWVACLMACWLPFQSITVSSSASLCYCKKVEKARPHTHCSSKHCHGHKHSHSSSKPKRNPQSISNPQRPCDCLPTCPCHEGSSPASTHLSCVQEGHRLAPAKTTSSLRFVVNDRNGAPALASAHPMLCLRWRPTLEFCAALCRFTI